MQEIIPGFRLEADGRGKSISLVISGARGVEELSEKTISVATPKEAIRIEGDALAVSVFESGSIGICGKIDTVSFAERKRGKRF